MFSKEKLYELAYLGARKKTLNLNLRIKDLIQLKKNGLLLIMNIMGLQFVLSQR